MQKQKTEAEFTISNPEEKTQSRQMSIIPRPSLTSWWLNHPFEKYESKWVHLPQFSGWKWKKIETINLLRVFWGDSRDTFHHYFRWPFPTVNGRSNLPRSTDFCQDAFALGTVPQYSILKSKGLLGCPVGSAGKRLGSVGCNPNESPIYN